MAYIDREKLKRDLIDNRSFYPAIVKSAIENAPTEDVVPRSEVDKIKKEYEEKITELKREIEDLESTQEITPEAKYLVDTKADKIISLLTEINKPQDQAKQDVAREIFEEIANILKEHDKRNGIIGNDYGDLLITDISCDIAELKKKYIS